MAQELIQEFFSGQTAQLQEIKEKVDEVHVERGGLPSGARSRHPVAQPLPNIRREGVN